MRRRKWLQGAGAAALASGLVACGKTGGVVTAPANAPRQWKMVTSWAADFPGLSDAASSLVVGLGIAGNLAGFPWLDPIAAAIVGFMIGRTGWGFAWGALGDLMDRGAGAEEVAAIETTLADTPGVAGVHALRTRKMGDLLLVDAHLEVDATLTVEAGHAIAVLARERVMKRHRVLDVMTHLDPWRPAAG